MSDEKAGQQTDAEVNHLIAERRAKLERVREQGVAFPNDFRRDALAGELHARVRRTRAGLARGAPGPGDASRAA